MITVTVVAKSKKKAIELCKKAFDFTPDAVREVDSGKENVRAWKCFESSEDARIWDNQK